MERFDCQMSPSESCNGQAASPVPQRISLIGKPPLHCALLCSNPSKVQRPKCEWAFPWTWATACKMSQPYECAPLPVIDVPRNNVFRSSMHCNPFFDEEGKSFVCHNRTELLVWRYYRPCLTRDIMLQYRLRRQLPLDNHGYRLTRAQGEWAMAEHSQHGGDEA
jgi:hypothetical protein